MIETREVDGIRILRLSHGKANLLDIEFLARLDEALERLESEPIRGAVMIGSDTIFSAGVDLFRVLDGGREYLEKFLPALSETIVRMFACSKPLVAAVNGHAIAGGCVLACACDVRLGVPEAGRIGVTELKVGVPFPAAALEVVRFVLSRNRWADAILGGRTYSPVEALAIGYLDRLVGEGELLDRAIAEASELADIGAAAFSFSKQQLRQAALEAIERNRPTSDPQILDLWSQPDTLHRIRFYLEQTLGRRS